MLRDVNVTVSDGSLMGNANGTGVHVKIGVSSVTSTSPILIRGTYDAKRIRELLGYSPLADACMDSVANGAGTIYCIPVEASVAGSAGAVTKTPADSGSTGTVAITGSPNNAYSLLVKITKAGALNEAGLKYSINGGVTWSDEMTMPLGGTLQIAPTGLTLTFTPGESGFAVGDTYTATTTAPGLSNEDLLSAVAKLRTFAKEFEFVHVVGASAKALWAACAAAAAEMDTKYHKPSFFVFEAPDPTGTAEEYKTALLTARTGSDSKYIQVVAARCQYKRMDGTTQTVNMAGIICGLYARAAVHQSIGEVRQFAISADSVVALHPVGVEDAIDDLDDAGYLTVRQYSGLTDYYVNNARMFAPEGSDYKYAERMRTTNKIIREVRKALLMQLQIPINIMRLDGELAAVAEFAQTPLDDMIAAGEISSARIIVPSGQDILTTESLSIIIRYVPVGYVREINVELAMENPIKEGN